MSVTDFNSAPPPAFDAEHRTRPEAERFGRGLVFGVVASVLVWAGLLALIV